MGKHDDAKPRPGEPKPGGDGQHPVGRPIPKKPDPGKHEKKK